MKRIKEKANILKWKVNKYKNKLKRVRRNTKDVNDPLTMFDDSVTAKHLYDKKEIHIDS